MRRWARTDLVRSWGEGLADERYGEYTKDASVGIVNMEYTDEAIAISHVWDSKAQLIYNSKYEFLFVALSHLYQQIIMKFCILVIRGTERVYSTFHLEKRTIL